MEIKSSSVGHAGDIVERLLPLAVLNGPIPSKCSSRNTSESHPLGTKVEIQGLSSVLFAIEGSVQQTMSPRMLFNYELIFQEFLFPQS